MEDMDFIDLDSTQCVKTVETENNKEDTIELDDDCEKDTSVVTWMEIDQVKNPTVFKCNHCPQAFPTRVALDKHGREEHMANLREEYFKRKPSLALHNCSQCNKKFANKKTFDEHTLSHIYKADPPSVLSVLEINDDSIVEVLEINDNVMEDTGIGYIGDIDLQNEIKLEPPEHDASASLADLPLVSEGPCEIPKSVLVAMPKVAGHLEVYHQLAKTSEEVDFQDILKSSIAAGSSSYLGIQDFNLNSVSALPLQHNTPQCSPFKLAFLPPEYSHPSPLALFPHLMGELPQVHGSTPGKINPTVCRSLITPPKIVTVTPKDSIDKIDFTTEGAAPIKDHPMVQKENPTKIFSSPMASPISSSSRSALTNISDSLQTYPIPGLEFSNFSVWYISGVAGEEDCKIKDAKYEKDECRDAKFEKDESRDAKYEKDECRDGKYGKDECRENTQASVSFDQQDDGMLDIETENDSNIGTLRTQLADLKNKLADLKKAEVEVGQSNDINNKNVETEVEEINVKATLDLVNKNIEEKNRMDNTNNDAVLKSPRNDISNSTPEMMIIPISPKSPMNRISPIATPSSPKDIRLFATKPSSKVISQIALPSSTKYISPIATPPSPNDVIPIVTPPSPNDVIPISIPPSPKDIRPIAEPPSPKNIRPIATPSSPKDICSIATPSSLNDIIPIATPSYQNDFIPIATPPSSKDISSISKSASPKDISSISTPSSPKDISSIAPLSSPKDLGPIAPRISPEELSPIKTPTPLKDIGPIAVIAPPTSPEKNSQRLNPFASPKLEEIRTEDKQNEKRKLDDRSVNKKGIEEINIANNNQGVSGTLHHLFVDFFSPKRSFNKCSTNAETSGTEVITPELPQDIDENNVIDEPTTSKVQQMLKLPADIEESNTLPTGVVTHTNSKLEVNASKLPAEVKNKLEEKTSKLFEEPYTLPIGVDTQTSETTYELEVSTSTLAAGSDESKDLPAGLELSQFFIFFKGEVENFNKFDVNKPHILKSDNLPVNEEKQENSSKGNKEIIAELKMLREDIRKERSMETSNYQSFNKRSKSMGADKPQRNPNKISHESSDCNSSDSKNASSSDSSPEEGECSKDTSSSDSSCEDINNSSNLVRPRPNKPATNISVKPIVRPIFLPELPGLPHPSSFPHPSSCVVLPRPPIAFRIAPQDTPDKLQTRNKKMKRSPEDSVYSNKKLKMRPKKSPVSEICKPTGVNQPK